MVIIGATFEQLYGHVLEEFVEYCNDSSKKRRCDDLTGLLNDYIYMKMERYREKDIML